MFRVSSFGLTLCTPTHAVCKRSEVRNKGDRHLADRTKDRVRRLCQIGSIDPQQWTGAQMIQWAMGWRKLDDRAELPKEVQSC